MFAKVRALYKFVTTFSLVTLLLIILNSTNAQETTFVVYYEKDGKLYSVPSLGGDIVPLYTETQSSLEWYDITSSGYVIMLVGNGNLFSIPVNGGELVQLNQGGQRVDRFIIAPDGQNLVFVDGAGTRTGDLYANRITGGTPVRLSSDDFKIGSDTYRFVSQISFTPDSAHVVFEAYNPRDVIQLYSVSVEGGQAQQISGRLSSGGNVVDFAITSDSSRVIYLADQVADEVYGLFGVPINGGDVISLTPETGLYQDRPVVLSPDGQYAVTVQRTDKEYLIVVNTSSQTAEVFNSTVLDSSFQNLYITQNNTLFFTDKRAGMYQVPLAGGETVQLYSPSRPDDYLISPDEKWVISGVTSTDGSRHIVSHSLIDGTEVSLAPGTYWLGTGAWPPIAISPDSKYVVFVSVDDNSIPQFYAVPISGGPVIQLNEFSGSRRFTDQAFRITSDGSRVIYMNDEFVERLADLFSVNITGGEVIRLTDDSSKGVVDFLLYPTGS